MTLAAASMQPVIAQDAPAAVLKNRYAGLREQLANNPFQRPVHLDSAETSGQVKGEIYAVIDAPFPTFNAALTDPKNWCDLLLLHVNNQYCRSSTSGGKRMLSLYVGKKSIQALSQAYPIQFVFRPVAALADYLSIQLNADEGPLGTKNYRISVEGAALEGDKTFLHLTYAYDYGLAGRIALQSYLATLGKNKVGFTPVVQQGGSGYVGGVRGLIERNTMRYYLAIEAYLGAYGLPQAEQQEKSLQAWYASTERYALQLHELDRADYLDMKRREYQRQQNG